MAARIFVSLLIFTLVCEYVLKIAVSYSDAKKRQSENDSGLLWSKQTNRQKMHRVGWTLKISLNKILLSEMTISPCWNSENSWSPQLWFIFLFSSLICSPHGLSQVKTNNHSLPHLMSNKTLSGNAGNCQAMIRGSFLVTTVIIFCTYIVNFGVFFSTEEQQQDPTGKGPLEARLAHSNSSFMVGFWAC